MNKINVKIRRGSDNDFKPVISATIDARVSVPFGFDMSIEWMKQSLEMFSCPTSGSDAFPCGRKPEFSKAKLLGRLESNWDDAITSREHRTLEFQHSDSPSTSRIQKLLVRASLNNSTRSHRDDRIFLQVGKESQKDYQSFLRDVIVQKSVKSVVRGTSMARIATGMGRFIEIEGLQYVDEVALEGLDGFKADGDLLEVTRNLEVPNVGSSGRLEFRMNGAYMKRIGSGQVGLELEAPLYFDMKYKADKVPVKDNSDLGVSVGSVTLPSLNLGDFGACTQTVRNPFTNVTKQLPSPYCAIFPFGTFKNPNSERDLEICKDRNECPGRSFLTEYLRGGQENPVKISLQASNGPRDLAMALSSIVLRNVSLPGYTPAVYDVRRAPFPIVRRIIVQPGWNFWDGKLWCWLEFYNPLQVPLRYYYMNVNTYLGNTLIGKLHANFTNYDPFEKKAGYVFPGYPRRPGVDLKNDPYGPHPSSKCVESGDCQIAPFDILPAGSGGPLCMNGYKSHTNLTRRLEVSFAASVPGIMTFWKSLFSRQDTVRMNVTISGQVAIGIGAEPYLGPQRNDSSVPPYPSPHGGQEDQNPQWRDPFYFPNDPSREKVALTWLDYGQDRTEMWFRKSGSGSDIPEIPPFFPPECDA